MDGGLCANERVVIKITVAPALLTHTHAHRTPVEQVPSFVLSPIVYGILVSYLVYAKPNNDHIRWDYIQFNKNVCVKLLHT